MHEQAAVPEGVTVKDVAFFIRGNVDPDSEKFSVLDDAVGILQIDPALPDGFHFGTGKLDSRLKSVLDKIVVAGFFILRNGFSDLFFHTFSAFRYFRCFRSASPQLPAQRTRVWI